MTCVLQQVMYDVCGQPLIIADEAASLVYILAKTCPACEWVILHNIQACLFFRVEGLG